MKKRYLSVEDFAKEFGEKDTVDDDVVVMSEATGYVMRDVSDDTETRRVTFAISDQSVDRDKDTIDPNGWKLDNYMKNPVVLWAHTYNALPIAKAASVTVDQGKLKSVAEFVPREISPFADTIYQMIKGGYLNATSVGFVPIKWTYSEDRVGAYGYGKGVDFIEQELLEYSVVPVPSNPNALVEARSAGIDLAPMRDAYEKFMSELVPGMWVPVTENTDVETLKHGVDAIQRFLSNGRKSFVMRFVDAGVSSPSSTGGVEIEEYKDVSETETKETEIEVKSGRTLSRKNEQKLQAAYDSIGEVLAAVQTQDDAEEDDSKSIDVDDDDEIEIEDDTDKSVDDEDTGLDADEVRKEIEASFAEAFAQRLAYSTGKID